MIVIREIFQIKFGMAKQAIEALNNGKVIIEKTANVPMRLLADITGNSYTVTAEMTHESLAAFESSLSKHFSNPEWQKWYESFKPLVSSSFREIMRIV